MSPASTHVIRGISFLVEQDGDTLYLIHPRASLVGCGLTLEEAERDVIDEARMLAEVTVDWDQANLSEAARDLLQDLRRLLAPEGP